MENKPILMSVPKVRTEILDCSVSLPTLYDWTEQEGFPLIRVGRKKLIPVEAFLKWLDSQIGKQTKP